MKEIAIVLNSPQNPLFTGETDFLCADGGYKWVVGAQKKPLALIGDFDSLATVPKDVPVVSLPRDKDYTDGEKAVRYAAQIGAEKISIYGADGGRADMQFANLSLLKIAYTLGVFAEIVTEKELIYYTESTFSYENTTARKRVSILPFGGNASFLSSENLLYPLRNITLTPGDTVGVSNRTTASSFSFRLQCGGVLVFIEK